MGIEHRATARLYVLGTIIVFSCFLCYWVLLIFSPVPNPGYEESNVVNSIQRVMNDSGLYSDPDQPLYPVTKYTPGYYILVATVADLLKVEAEQVSGLYILNRFISFLLLLLTSFVVGLIARKITGLTSRQAWLLSAIVFIFMETSAIGHPVSLSHMLFFLSLLFFLWGLRSNQPNKEVIQFSLAGLTAGLAVLSWQYDIVLPLASVVGLLLVKKYKACGVYFISFSAAMTLGLVLIDQTMRVDLFARSILPASGEGSGIKSFFDFIASSSFGLYGWLGVIMMTALLTRYANGSSLTNRFVVFLMLFQFAAGCLFSLLAGPSTGFFTTWWILVLLGVAIYRDHIDSFFSSISPRLALLLFITILVVRLSVIIYPAYNQILHGVPR